MSIYAHFDEFGPDLQIATNLGWTHFGNWADSIKSPKFPIIRKLWIDGECLDLPGLRKELEKALTQNVVAENCDQIADGIIHSIDAAGKADFLLVTNGMMTATAKKKRRNG